MVTPKHMSCTIVIHQFQPRLDLLADCFLLLRYHLFYALVSLLDRFLVLLEEDPIAPSRNTPLLTSHELLRQWFQLVRRRKQYHALLEIFVRLI
jgi:hypothetical protein